VRRAPPQISLGAIALGANALEDFASAHIEKLDINILMF
jgi:hypothetical protein